MSDPATPDPNPPAPADISKGKAAFEELLSVYKKIDADDLVTVSADIPRASLAVLGIIEKVIDPDLVTRFESLPAKEFDISHLHTLPKAAWGAWYAAIEGKKARALSSDAQIPADLVQKAVVIEKRMQACCEYYFNDDPEIGQYLSFLRSGTGTRDIATDLLGYASVYVEQHDTIKDDKKHYRPTDAEEAVKVAEQMLELLGAGLTPEARLATDNLARAWTLLVKSYDEVCQTGRWLLRHERDVEKRLPRIFSVARNGVRRGRQKKADEPTG